MKNKVSELGNEFMNIDGDVLNYEVANGLQNIGNNFHENGLSNTDMSFADGTENDDFYNADGDDYYGYGGDNDGDADDFYNARGGGLFSNYRKNQKIRQKRRDDKNKSKNQARQTRGEASKMKADAKQRQGDAQIESAKAMGKGVEGDVALANALAKNQPEESKGLSLGAKIGIGAVVLILGVAGYFIYKKMKKGK